jgi:hypothetical protein
MYVSILFTGFCFISAMVIISLFKASTTNPGRVPLVEDTQIGLYNFYQLDIE